MEITPTIRAELDRYLKEEGLSLIQFGHIAGMNRGAVSAIVSGNKSMSVNQLDLITEAMGLPEGHFYDLFIDNYIIDLQPNMRRIEPFLYRCAELDKLLLYEGVAEVEKYQHSERLAICHYRIFTIQVGDDQKRNLRAATIFKVFVELIYNRGYCQHFNENIR